MIVREKWRKDSMDGGQWTVDAELGSLVRARRPPIAFHNKRWMQ